MDENIRIDTVFEEKFCICGHYSVDKFTDITDSFIKYRNKLISLIEIVRETLCFEPEINNFSPEICEPCKTKVLDFYNFKIRSRTSRENFNNQVEIKLEEVPDVRDNEIIEYKLLEIIRNYIKAHSINRIEVEEDSNKLLVISGSRDEPNEEVLVSKDAELKIEYSDKINEILDTEPEYLEEFLEECDDTNEALYCTEQDTEYEEVLEFQEDDVSNTRPSKSSNLKRSRNPDEWQSNKRKKLRNSGKSYINTKGRIVKERQMLESCAVTNCRTNCQSRISENDRLMNFNNYWELGDVVEQRKFIYNHILSREPTRRKSIQSNRTVTLQFYLDVLDSQGNQVFVQVCKKMFKNTLAISNQVIQGVVSKYSNLGFADYRGRHKRKLTEAQELARQHAQKFPFFYVDQNMTIVQLYNMYVNDCKNSGIEPVKESNYRDIFDKFNTNSFLKAEKVLCEKCHQFYKSSDEEKQLLQKEHNQHLEESKKCRDRAFGRIRHKRAMEKKKAEQSEMEDKNEN